MNSLHSTPHPPEFRVDKIAFEGPSADGKLVPDRGFTLRVSYLKGGGGNALVEVFKGQVIRRHCNALVEVFKDQVLRRHFIFPAYKIYNLQAHFTDIVDGELSGSESGYAAAASTGLEHLASDA